MSSTGGNDPFAASQSGGHGEHMNWTRDQLLHLLYATGIFVVLASFAVALDLAANAMPTLGVSGFTSTTLSHAAHALLGFDLFLFAMYFLRTSYDILRGLLP